MKINTALILCAGLGKRLSPLTQKIPKPLLKLNNITMLENCINQRRNECSFFFDIDGVLLKHDNL